jgi:hypothetical protein
MPNEPPEYGFDNKVLITAYPTQEQGGVVWAYMGPPEYMPTMAISIGCGLVCHLRNWGVVVTV